jgi:enamine deaminase RidA (YjgF/YER057c/UK114 family)
MKDLGYFALCLGIGAMVGLVYERGKVVGKTELAEQAVEAFGEIAEVAEEVIEKISES